MKGWPLWVQRRASHAGAKLGDQLTHNSTLHCHSQLAHTRDTNRAQSSCLQLAMCTRRNERCPHLALAQHTVHERGG